MLGLGCGPSVGEDDDGETTRGDASSSTTNAGSTTSQPTASTAADTTTGSDTTTEPEASSSESTGSGLEPVACFADVNMEETECCPQLPKPCPGVRHECPEIACEGDPFATPVTEPMPAQCMLAALAEGGTAVFDRVEPYGLGARHEQWLVAASGDVTRLNWAIQDLGVGYGFETCRLVEAEVLAACAMELELQVLSDCLAGALEGCEEVMDPVCPE